MSSILSDRSWVLDTRGVNGTVVIGASFIFLAYVLHPAVEYAYSRVRAYRAWRSIEMRQAVEVTNYSLMAELFGGRRRWDAARIITALLAVFSLASWGLELSMELATHTGVTDLLNRPPPVEVVNDTSGANVWKVKSRADLDYDGEWSRLPGMFHERAKSRYNKAGRFINGEIPVATWNEEPNDELFYYTGDTTTMVEGLNCTGDGDSYDRKGVYLGDEPWGSVFSCDNGPRLTSGLQEQIHAKDATPPTIVLNHSKDQKAFLIVEESSSYPSFHYSIWTVVGTETGGSVELQHMFHIAATMRMAEAVVTGIVHGETTGGGCFGLLRQYSDLYPSYDNEALRAFPFGERPDGDSNEKIEDLETIEYGLKVGADALMCFVWIMLLTTIGAVWSICLYSSTGMDVYDRDELIRAVTLHEVAPGARPRSDIRIFVRREDTGSISVVISDTGTADNGCRQFFRRGNQVVEDIEPSPVAAAVDQYNRGFGGVGVPMGPRTMWLEGVRMGMSRALPGPNGDYQYPMSVELNGSPVPSNTGSVVSTPMPSPSQRAFVPPGGSWPAAGRGASAMFDSDNSPPNSPEETPNGMPTARCGSTIPSDGVSGAYNAAIDGERPTLANSQATSASDTERSRWSNRSVGNCELVTSPVSPDMKSPERRGLARGRQQPRGRTHDSEDDTEECTSSSENLEMETKECSPSCETRSIGDE